MINWAYIVARVVGAIGPWIEASNLRNRCLKMAEESEIMMTALEDIERMSQEPRIKQYARRAIDTVRGLP